MKRNCELCKNKAAIYCDSDQASLCWTCDAKVHSANFLVARHSRCLLCHVCQSLTPWTASGSKLGPTLSVCQDCLGGDDEEEESSNGSENDESDDNDDGDVLEEEEENQVVPWSATPASPPPAASSSSSSEESTNGQPEVSRKRQRENALDRWYNGDSGDVSRVENDLMAPMLTEEAAEAGGSGGAEDETAFGDSSSTSMIRRRRPLKARRIETGPIDRADGDTTE